MRPASKYGHGLQADVGGIALVAFGLLFVVVASLRAAGQRYSVEAWPIMLAICLPIVIITATIAVVRRRTRTLRALARDIAEIYASALVNTFTRRGRPHEQQR